MDPTEVSSRSILTASSQKRGQNQGNGAITAKTMGTECRSHCTIIPTSEFALCRNSSPTVAPSVINGANNNDQWPTDDSTQAAK